MPEYFSMSIGVNKKKKYDMLYNDFINLLIEHEFKILNGLDGENLEEVITWNRKKIEDDFELGYDEDVSHDYKQILWDYCGLSEVRNYIYNEKENGFFEFVIIIPEAGFITYNNAVPSYDLPVINGLKQLALKFWKWECVESIQTDLELTKGYISLTDIVKGECPSVNPFAIMPAQYVNKVCEKYFTIEKIENNGVLLEEKV